MIGPATGNLISVTTCLKYASQAYETVDHAGRNQLTEQKNSSDTSNLGAARR